MISHDEFVHLIGEGEDKVRVNHDSPYCSGDSKSLLITRNDDESISAYCFRCGEKGYYKEKHFRKPSKRTLTRISTGKPYLPIGGEPNPLLWPAKAKAWVYKARLGNPEILEHQFEWNERIGRVVMPCFDPHTKDLIGYQARRIVGEEGPKIYTKGVDTSKLFWHPIYNIYNNNIVILTEDILSSIRINKYYSSIALLGVYLKDYLKEFLIENYKEVYVFLDNDNSKVIKEAIRIKETLSTYLECHIITHKGDPKNLSDKELREVLSGTIST